MAKERKTYRKKRKTNTKRGALLILAVVLVFAAAMGFRMQTLSDTYRRYELQYAAQQEALAFEQKRSEELAELANHEQTDEDIEKVARERLGLIKPGEILLRPER